MEIPDGPPPCNLVISDLVTGTGAEAISGKTITVKYVGVTYATGKEFDASWGGEDFTFPLGGGRVIQGWDQGFAGMKEGGRRQLVIPPDLGYGDQGAGGDIPPGATLVFVVDLVKVG
ncbi:MAG: FKBP-type peptidyl-prolyl cis-trans isomerase [Actinobacteria bacterium]|nr:FKBP-type peptidyl-prolyl cis-trans isomerase [Actinomycetota bacterium]MCA1720246.1 FKBP-type peptidyl-prolyl cis-trans isomerase [Actinomycetota bacterium]